MIHADHCEKSEYEGGICTCELSTTSDDYPYPEEYVGLGLDY